MADYPTSTPRPGMPHPKPTQVRYAKAQHQHAQDLASQSNNTYLTLDTLLISLGYASLAGYLYHSAKKFSPWEIAGITAGAAGVGLGLLDYGSRSKQSTNTEEEKFVGIPGSLPPSRMPSRQNSIMGSVAGSRRNSLSALTAELEDESWKGIYQNRPWVTLTKEEKMELLNMEEEWINFGLEEKQLACGQAYIAKEKAYVSYEKFGAYGGADWKKFVDADKECKDVYKLWKRGEARLEMIKVERLGLEESA